MHEKTISIKITPRTVMAILIFVAIGWMMFQIKDVLILIICSIIFALAIAPAKRFLERFKIPGPIAVLLIYIFAFLILAFLLFSMIPILLEQFSLFIDSVPSILEFVRGFVDVPTLTSGANAIADDVAVSEVFEEVSATLTETIKFLGAGIFGLFGGLLNILLFLLLTFLFAVNPRSLDNFIEVITPANYRNYIDNLWSRTKDKIGHWLQGQLVLVFIIGALTFLGLKVLGVPNALFLASLAGIMELIPIFGPIIAAVPALLMALTTGDFKIVLGTLILFIVIQQLENNLIYPLVVTKVVGISSVLIILSIVIGGTLAGFVGIVISVPIAGAIQEFFSDIRTGKFKKLQEDIKSGG